MRFILLLIIPVILSATQCTKNSLVDVPACVQKKINKIKGQPKWSPPATVNEYLYKDKKVYLFSSDCCDQYNELCDENCNRICAPSGGITGNGDGLCPDFKTSATFIRLVWKDER